MVSRYKSILVGVDGSEASEKAFDEALCVARENKSTLFIAWIDTEIKRKMLYKGLSDREQLIHDKKLLPKVEEAKNFGVEKVIPIIKTGDPKRYLSNWLPRDYKIDLIILGAATKKILDRLIIGSTAKYVVEHSKCTVTIVK